MKTGTTFTLPKAASRHICQVLRLDQGAAVTLFNGDGKDYSATLVSSGKAAVLKIQSTHPNDNESGLAVHLVQGVSRGDRMDTTIQKAVELGVTQITPVMTRKSAVRLPAERLAKKLQHWNGIIIAACEQSQRSVIPALNPVIDLLQWLAHMETNEMETNEQITNIVLEPESTLPLGRAHCQAHCQLLVGPESGFTADELSACTTAGFIGVSLGPRILRTETAGATAIGILQALHGDLG